MDDSWGVCGPRIIGLLGKRRVYGFHTIGIRIVGILGLPVKWMIRTGYIRPDIRK